SGWVTTRLSKLECQKPGFSKASQAGVTGPRRSQRATPTAYNLLVPGPSSLVPRSRRRRGRHGAILGRIAGDEGQMPGRQVLVTQQAELHGPGAPGQVGARLQPIAVELRMILEDGGLESLCPAFLAVLSHRAQRLFHGVAKGILLAEAVEVALEA